jgi:hypothetical protein
MPTYRASGHHGSWFAEANGERLPCVHEYWCKKSNSMVYDDPHFDPTDRKWGELVEAIKTSRRVILTRDEVVNGGRGFKRLGYIAIFEIDGVATAPDNHLRFRFTRRIANLI